MLSLFLLANEDVSEVFVCLGLEIGLGHGFDSFYGPTGFTFGHKVLIYGFEGFTQVLLVFEMVLVFDHVGFGFSDAVAGFMVMQF